MRKYAYVHDKHKFIEAKIAQKNTFGHLDTKYSTGPSRGKVWKSGRARSNEVGIMCPRAVEIGLTDLPKTGGGTSYPSPPPKEYPEYVGHFLLEFFIRR